MWKQKYAKTRYSRNKFIVEYSAEVYVLKFKMINNHLDNVNMWCIFGIILTNLNIDLKIYHKLTLPWW